jgi:NADH-quinone oxidoreductase subunit N
LISPADKITRHLGEYYSLILFGSVGLMVMVSTEELLVAFIGLETASLTLYVLTAFNKQNVNSVEAALKYFLFGSASAAFTLFGISLIYGLTGTTNFHSIAEALTNSSLDPLLLLAIALTVMGFAFKIAAVPMHLWAPDAYQGAPIPSAALIASGSKLASLFLFTKFFVNGLPGQAGSGAWADAISGWMPAIALLSFCSVVFGNLVAITQVNVRRLLAYSAIAHGGYALLGVIAANEHGLAAIIYYMFTYGLAIIGIFGVIGIVEKRHGMLNLGDLSGLSRRAPLLAGCLMVFVLSLAGIPPLAGFFGKFYLFLAALQSSPSRPMGLLWLVVAAVAGSAVSLYYYLQILKSAYVVEGDESNERLAVPWSQTAIITVLAAAVIVFGCFPNLLLGPLESACRTPIASHSDSQMTLVAQ